MEGKQPAKKLKTLMIALVLLVLVVATAIYLCIRLGVFSKQDNQPYIDINPTVSTAPTAEATEPTAQTQGQEEAIGGATQPGEEGSGSASTESTFEARPEMIVWDDEQVWTTNTEITLFHIRYENGQQEVTVLSDNGDAVIAPGTENSYTFRLKNTGNVSLNYTVTLNTEISDNVEYLPVEVRMRDFNGFYCIGDDESYAPLEELNGLQDHNTLGAGYYAYYTLEWQWPFEGDDSYDTFLGNLATEEPVTLTISINTLASVCDDPNYPGGLIPSTGDRANPVAWIILMTVALAALVALVFWKKRKDPEDEK